MAPPGIGRALVRGVHRSMPGFGKILTEEKLREVVAWLKTKNVPPTTQR